MKLMLTIHWLLLKFVMETFLLMKSISTQMLNFKMTTDHAHDVAFPEVDRKVRVYYKDIESVTAISDLVVRIEMIIQSWEIVCFKSTAYYQAFLERQKTSAAKWTASGSGPYKIISYAGQSVITAWWKLLGGSSARAWVVLQGSSTTIPWHCDVEAFKAEFDLEQNSAQFWANSPYKLRDGLMSKKRSITRSRSGPSFVYIFSGFSDPSSWSADRDGLWWMNKNMFYSQYKRTRSYFQNTDYEAKGLPSEDEVALLSQYKEQIPPRVYGRIPTSFNRW